MRRVGGAVSAVVVVALLLAGCTHDDPAPNYSTVSPSPSGSPSASPTPSSSFPTSGPNLGVGELPPTRPTTADQDDSEGALAFAAFYLQSLDWAFGTGQTAFLEDFYSDTCTTCQSRLDYLDGLFAGGNTFLGGRLTILKQEVVPDDGRLGADTAVSTAVSVAASHVITSVGATVSPDPGIDFISLTTWLRWDAGRWRIVEEGYA